jgi:hypothetical protein
MKAHPVFALNAKPIKNSVDFRSLLSSRRFLVLVLRHSLRRHMPQLILALSATSAALLTPIHQIYDVRCLCRIRPLLKYHRLSVHNHDVAASTARLELWWEITLPSLS